MRSSGTWRFCGQELSEGDLALIHQVVGEFQGLSRIEIAATVCEILGWVRASGSPKARECWELLEDMESAGALVLPVKHQRRPMGSRTEVPVSPRGEPGPRLTGSVEEFRPIRLSRVESRDDHLFWRELVGRYHYLGHAVPYGAQLRYFVRMSPGEGTVVGCVQLSSPAWRMAARDRWIGWDDATRAKNLQRIVCNSRLLILPWVEVRNLSSTVLAQVSRQVLVDWPRQYGIEPYLMETLVDGEHFEGTCYRAAGWKALGSTSGRGRMDREHQREGLSPKLVFVKPLVRDAAGKLRGGSIATKPKASGEAPCPRAQRAGGRTAPDTRSAHCARSMEGLRGVETGDGPEYGPIHLAAGR